MGFQSPLERRLLRHPPAVSCKCSPPTSREFPVSVGEGSRLWPILSYQCDVTNWEQAGTAGLGAVEASSSASGPQGAGVTMPARCPLGPFRMHPFSRIWGFLVIKLLLNGVSVLYSLLLFDVLLIIGRQVRQSLILFSQPISCSLIQTEGIFSRKCTFSRCIAAVGLPIFPPEMRLRKPAHSPVPSITG